jgi:hypothetical protein
MGLVLGIVLQAILVFPVRAAYKKGGAETLQLKMDENLVLSRNGTVRMAILMNVSAPQLADMYREILAAPTDAAVEEEVPIPENASVGVDLGENEVKIPVEVRESFYKSIMKEQLLSLGLNASVYDSMMIPRGNANECRVSLEAKGYFEVFNVTQTGSDGLWEIGIGPFNITGITGIMFSKLMFVQMMLGSLQGEYQYECLWRTKIALPEDSILLDEAESLEKNWTIDFGGGSYLAASTRLYGAEILVEERSVITKENITASAENLYNDFLDYKAFKIRYVLPTSSLQNNENGTAETVNTNWSLGTAQIDLPTISMSKTFANETTGYNVTMRLTLAPKLSIEEDIGWQWDWRWYYFIPYPQIVKFWSITTVKFSTNITLEVEASWIKKWEWGLFNKTIFPLDFAVGPVPVHIDVRLGVDVTLDLNASASFVLTTVVNATVSAGIQWTETNGWSQPRKTDFNIGMGDFVWNAYVEITVTPSVRFRLEFRFYDVAGPYVELEPYAKIRVAAKLPNFVVNLSLSLGFKINVGIIWDQRIRSILTALRAPPDLTNDRRWTAYDNPDLWSRSWSYPLNGTAGEPSLIHDLSVVDLTLSQQIVFVGDDVDVGVVINNNGAFNESSRVTLSCNGILVNETGNVDFLSQRDTIITFGWDTRNLVPGRCTLVAGVDEVTNETKGQDNSQSREVQVVEVNDIALITLTASTNRTYMGEDMNASVVVKNMGKLTQDVNITVFSNDTIIATKSIKDLSPSVETSFDFVMNTTSASSRANVYPEVLNLRGESEWITVVFSPDPVDTRLLWATASVSDYDINMTNNVIHGDTVTIEHVENLNVSDIDVSSLVLNGVIPVDSSIPATIGDFDNDSIQDLTVHFNKSRVAELLISQSEIYGDVNLEITGRLDNATPFQAVGTIKVKMPGDVQPDGIVNISDAIVAANAFGSSIGQEHWNALADENGDGSINIIDVINLARNFGVAYVFMSSK